jgi:hypothetical protein
VAKAPINRATMALRDTPMAFLLKST